VKKSILALLLMTAFVVAACDSGAEATPEPTAEPTLVVTAAPTAGQTTVVPPIVGLMYDPALVAIADAGLVLRLAIPADSDEARLTVVFQQPAAGTEVEAGSDVDITYSEPVPTPAPTAVPDASPPAAEAAAIEEPTDLVAAPVESPTA
jgi:hypothetical protein